MTRPEAAPAPPPPKPSGTGLPAAAASFPGDEDDLPQTFFLGRYRVVDEIGVGGMASVHLARVDGPGGFQKWIAIKRIHPHLVEDDQFVDMFLDEARIAAGINHANVAQVFDLGKDDNTYWIAMEYLHGEPLRELMRRVDDERSTIPGHIAARICADAAEGLHGAHELRGRNGQLLNLVHRDVTPHNLFVTYDGYTKVVDFGIAKVVDRLASTRAGTLKGKLAYMSPEQVRGQDVDRRTDIFALGVVLWELTTGQRLFRMDTDLDTLEKVQACVVPLPSTIVDGYSPELQEVVMKALSQRKEERFQTAREFSRALQRFLMKQGAFVGPEDVGDYTKALFEDRVKKREKYLEWAAEVTSAVDIDALHAQQQVSEQASPSLLHDAAAPPAAGRPPAGQAQAPQHAAQQHAVQQHAAQQHAVQQHAAQHTPGQQHAAPHTPGQQHAAQQHAAPQHAAPHTAGRQHAAPHPAAPHTAAPHTAGQQHAAPHPAAPHPAAPHTAAPHPAAPHPAAPHTAAPHTAAPHPAGQQHAAPHPAGQQQPAPQYNYAAQPMAGPPPGPPPPPAPHQHAAAQLPPQQMRSYGQEAHSAAIVTSAPIHSGAPDLASASLLDEDEDIPTVVAQLRPDSLPSGGPRPAAGQPRWDGNATQLMAEGAPPGGFDSTIALPDSNAAMGIQQNVDQLGRQPPPPPAAPQHADYPQVPGGAAELHNANQAAIETKMSLPRPAAVAQWLMEQGDVEIGGPRSTGVIIAIAALATLCVMGVASLIVYKLRLPPRTDPSSLIGLPDGPAAQRLPDEDEEAFAGSYDKKKKRVAARVIRKPVA